MQQPVYPQLPDSEKTPIPVTPSAPPPANNTQHPEPPTCQQKSPGTNANKAVTKGVGAYGGSEVGSLVGGLVGPPIIGNIVGNLVGEKVGESVIESTGIDKKVGKAGDALSDVIGKRNVDKIGDIALTATGYSEEEVCVCCPCLPASQLLLVIAIPFLIFNWYKLVLGIVWDFGCSSVDVPGVEEVPEDGSGAAGDIGDSAAELDTFSPNVTNRTEPVVYPCQQGFHYLVVSGAVWVTILPCWICGLFGNCWRQCCCCCCDPIVITATIVDFVKRCCCEIGRFNCCSFIWYSFCIFHIVWAITAVVWLAGLTEDRAVGEGWNLYDKVWGVVVASVVLDLLLAGSEIFHRIRLHQKRREIVGGDVELNAQTEKLNNGDKQDSAGQCNRNN